MATDWAAIIARIDTAISQRIDGGIVEEYQIRGRSVRYSTIPQLQELRDWASRKLAATKGAPFVYGVPRRAGG